VATLGDLATLRGGWRAGAGGNRLRPAINLNVLGARTPASSPAPALLSALRTRDAAALKSLSRSNA